MWAANPNIIAMFPSLIYQKLKNCSVVQNVDDLWPEALYDLGLNRKSVVAWIGEFVAKATYRLASAITPISSAYVNVVTEKYGVEPGKVCVVPAGVDLALFSSKKEIVDRRERPFRVLYIGAFSPAYDFDQVFKAAKSLMNFPNIEFVIQGGGELAATLQKRLDEEKLANVKVINKIVSRKEVAEILRGADAVLLPLNGIGSIELGISSKLYEYQAAAKPIICCSKGQPGRYVSRTGSGIVIKPGDYEALAKAVINLLNDPEMARIMGENGREFVENENSIAFIALKMIRMLETLKLIPPNERTFVD